MTRLNRLYVRALVLLGGLISAAIALGAADTFPA